MRAARPAWDVSPAGKAPAGFSLAHFHDGMRV